MPEKNVILFSSSVTVEGLTNPSFSFCLRLAFAFYFTFSDTRRKYAHKSILEHTGVELACQKISLAVGLIQCFMSDSLHSHGLGRKTFVALSPCEVFHSEISLEKSHSLTESALWEYHAKELLARRLADDDTKVLAVLSATRFVNTLGRPPRDHSEMMSLTKSHGALGGGGLAMFGSGCLYAWPSLLHEVQDAFLNSSKIDSLNLMDDSGYRHTFGACFSTTLGAIIHELGHTFDLGHTNDGIMARGFDDLHRYFTIQSSNNSCTGTDIPDVTMNGGSSHDEEILLSPTRTTRFTNFKQDGASYLQAYQQKKELRRMVADSGKAFWSRSCALILSSHRWFNPVPKDTECNDVLPSLSLIGGILSVNCNGDGHVVLLELRKNDRVIGFVEVPNGPPLTPNGSGGVKGSYQEFSLDKIIVKYSETNEIVVVTSTGFIWSCHYPVF
nr:putative zinc metalloproteinase YIL108W isoform X2 [Lepeophtheirus salmonis]